MPVCVCVCVPVRTRVHKHAHLFDLIIKRIIHIDLVVPISMVAMVTTHLTNVLPHASKLHTWLVNDTQLYVYQGVHVFYGFFLEG